jgi:hypothetical protein
VKTTNISGGKTMSDRPYGSFDDVIGAIVGQLNERRGHEAAGVSDPLGVLRAAQERYAAPNPFRPGDVVTPRALTSMKGIGEPHVVLEVGEPRGSRPRTPPARPSARGTTSASSASSAATSAPSGSRGWMLEPYVAPRPRPRARRRPMGESRRRKALGGGHIRPAVDIDIAIEEVGAPHRVRSRGGLRPGRRLQDDAPRASSNTRS